MTVTTPTQVINTNFQKAKIEIEALKDKNARNIGELVYSSIPLSDAGLHLLDGSLISGTGIYAGFVTYIASLYNNSGSSYANCFVTESQWQETLSNYRVCGKFVYTAGTADIHWYAHTVSGKSGVVYMKEEDANKYGEKIKLYSSDGTVAWSNLIKGWQGVLADGATYHSSMIEGDDSNGDSEEIDVGNLPVTETITRTAANDIVITGQPATVRLPKITGVVEGTITAAQVGSIVEASLPSTITSSNYFMVASSDNTTIEDPDEVQPQTTKLLVYMVVANSTKTEIEVDIDNVASDLNTLSGNVNTLSSEVGTLSSSISNIVSDNSSDIAALIAPSSVYVQTSGVSSGTHLTAPATGWFFVNATIGTSSSSGWLFFQDTTSLMSKKVYGRQFDSVHADFFVKKNTRVFLAYENLYNAPNVIFSYAEGTKHEKT